MKKRLIFSSGLANAFEWYDYALFGHLAPIIGQKFFPDSDPTVALLSAFLVFGAGYLTRPIGGLIFGLMGDKLGRKTALSNAIFLMAFPTAFIGLIPSYENIGIYAPLLMLLARLLQGLSMGGALTGSIAFLIEHSPNNQHGIVGSVPIAGICIGILTGSLIITFIQQLCSPADYLDWGWRLPFILGILVVFASLYIKKYTLETPSFQYYQNAGLLDHSPVKTILKNYKINILISILINSTGSVLFYLQAMYIPNYLKLERQFNHNDIDFLTNIIYIFMTFAVLFTSWVSDKVGRLKLYTINIILIICSCLWIINKINYGNLTELYLAQIILAFTIAAYIGPEPALQAEFYPVNIRNTSLSIAYNLATTLFGGTTPYIVGYFVLQTNSLDIVGYYIVLLATVSLIALYFYHIRINNDKFFTTSK